MRLAPVGRSVTILRSGRQELSPDGGRSRLHCDSSMDSVDFEQPHIYSHGAKATIGLGYFPLTTW
jgi:hypothetical protein